MIWQRLDGGFAVKRTSVVGKVCACRHSGSAAGRTGEGGGHSAHPRSANISQAFEQQADKVERGTLDLIKGLGSALLREKRLEPRATVRSWSTAARWWIGLGREHGPWWLRPRGDARVIRSKCSAPALARGGTLRSTERRQPRFLIAISAASPIRRDWRSALWAMRRSRT